MKTTVLVAAIAAVTMAGAAQAAVTTISTQAAFSAAGTIVQNTNFDSNGTGFTSPGSPYTVGALTFVEGSENLIGGQSAYGMARALFTDNNIAGTTVQIAGTHNLFAFNAGNFFAAGATVIDIVTNLGSYQFTVPVTSYANGGSLTFLGYQAGVGEYFTSVRYSGQFATGGTDFQIGTAVVPEPASWAMMLIGFGLVGATLRRRTTVAA